MLNWHTSFHLWIFVAGLGFGSNTLNDIAIASFAKSRTRAGACGNFPAMRVENLAHPSEEGAVIRTEVF
jgi:hypothetical protein